MKRPTRKKLHFIMGVKLDTVAMFNQYVCEECGAEPDIKTVEGQIDLEANLEDMLYEIDADPGVIYERHARVILTVFVLCEICQGEIGFQVEVHTDLYWDQESESPRIGGFNVTSFRIVSPSVENTNLTQ